IPVQSPNIAAVLLRSQRGLVLIFLVYIPRDGATLAERVQLLQDTISKTKEKEGPDLKILVTGDFNRHDQL
ncbi:uncharacterized protein K452DRAFT_239060, partial [Aplosporella prunicola CBS 121167]